LIIFAECCSAGARDLYLGGQQLENKATVTEVCTLYPQSSPSQCSSTESLRHFHSKPQFVR